jgi:hypothetical protein
MVELYAKRLEGPNAKACHEFGNGPNEYVFQTHNKNEG